MEKTSLSDLLQYLHIHTTKEKRKMCTYEYTLGDLNWGQSEPMFTVFDSSKTI
jgi:hypothetical protein